MDDRLDSFLFELETLIKDRHATRPEGSYTTHLFNKGRAKIFQKVGEEAVETVIAAMKPDTEELKNEAADLIYHLIVGLVNEGVSLSDILTVLKARHSG